MARLFPPSTNADYRGARISPVALGLLALGTLIPGSIHAFLPDGGAGVIAGLDLSGPGAQIPGVFAWAGATQIAWGLMLAAVALSYRSLTPLAFALILLERTIMAANMWLLKSGAGDHQPPEAYATLVMVPVVGLLLVLSLRPRRTA